MTEVTRETELLQRAVSAVPTPLIRQCVILFPVLIDLVVRLTMGDVRGGYYMPGLAVLGLATVAAAV